MVCTQSERMIGVLFLFDIEKCRAGLRFVDRKETSDAVYFYRW